MKLWRMDAMQVVGVLFMEAGLLCGLLTPGVHVRWWLCVVFLVLPPASAITSNLICMLLQANPTTNVR